MCYERRVATHLEIERKYDAIPGRALPPLDDVPGIGRADEAGESSLEATYFDTEDLRLARHKVTFRRRTGGSDAGWHVKLPASGDARTEVRAPLGHATMTPPTELQGEVTALVRARPLRPVAVLRTARVERTLVDGEGRPVAVVADDTVTAERLTGQLESSTWREVEVELVDPDAIAVLDAVESRLLAAGMTRSGSSSKLGRVLGEPAKARPESGLRGNDAGDVVHAHLAEQVAELVALDRAARADAPDGVHKMRVATRRLRSALATFRPMLDRTRTDPLRAELKWLGAALGASRDGEVMHARLLDSVRTQPAELVLGPVAADLERELAGRHAQAHASLLEALDTPRYLRLLDDLDALLEETPWTLRARRPAEQELRRLVRRTLSRVEAARQAVDDARTPEQRVERLHQVRKDAKRARYACEAVSPALSGKAGALAKRWEAVQEVLGEYQDSVVARRLLRDLGVRAHVAGENAFTYGLLHGLENGRGEAVLVRFAVVWPKAARASAQRWLR